MDLVCDGYLVCVIANLLFGFFFGGWILFILLVYIAQRLLKHNLKFGNYGKIRQVLIASVVVLIIAFLVVSVLYVFYGEGSESTNLGF